MDDSLAPLEKWIEVVESGVVLNECPKPHRSPSPHAKIRPEINHQLLTNVQLMPCQVTLTASRELSPRNLPYN